MSTGVSGKPNLQDRREIVVQNAPASFEPELRKRADWSALRFRRAEFIRSLRRTLERALSAQGRARVART
jgi:hypothetical protein